MVSAIQKKNQPRFLSSASPLTDSGTRARIISVRRLRRERRLRCGVSAVLVVGMHAGLAYALAQAAELVMPRVSVPLVISLATAAEPAPAKPSAVAPVQKPRPKTAPKPKLAEKTPVTAPAPEPLPLPEPAPDVEPPMEQQPEPVQEPPPSPPLQTAAIEAPAPPQVIPPRFDAAYLNNPVPPYPRLSQRMREEGRVLLRVYVKSDGFAGEVQVTDSSGWPRLDRAAMQAVERWKFAPARRGHEAVGAWVLVPVNFTLSQG